MWQPISGRARRPEHEVSHTQNRSSSYWPEIRYGSTWEQGLGSVPVLGDPLWLRSSHSVTGEVVLSSIGRNWRVQTGDGGVGRKPCLPWREGLWVLEIAGQGVGGCGI